MLPLHIDVGDQVMLESSIGYATHSLRHCAPYGSNRIDPCDLMMQSWGKLWGTWRCVAHQPQPVRHIAWPVHSGSLDRRHSRHC